MKRPYAAFTGSGGRPTDREIDSDMYNVFPQWKQGIYILVFGLAAIIMSDSFLS